MITIQSLAKIGMKPTTTQRDTLTIARHVCRLLCETRDEINRQRRELRRQSRKLRQFEPFTRLAADKMELKARDHRAFELENTMRGLLGYGRLFVLDPEGYAESLGFEALADLLNINRVDRAHARREGWRTISDLVATHDLERSSERRDREWGKGSPLYEACFVALVEFINETPAHLLPDPFAACEVLGPKLRPMLGSVK